VASGVDYRMAFTTTDLRTPTAQGRFRDAPPKPNPDSGACPAVERTADCALDPSAPAGAPRLAFGPLLSNGGGDLTAEALGDRFTCLAVAGTTGDGFEKGLEAMRLALDCNGPNASLFSACCVPGERGHMAFDPTCPGSADAAPEFLRPAAELVVVFLSDEVDCSDPVANAWASRRAICKHGPEDGGDDDALPDGFADADLCPGGDAAACYAEECGDLTPEACHAARCVIDRSDNDHCEWKRDALTPVGEYVDFLKALKPGRPKAVSVVSIVGERSHVDLAGGEQVEVTWVEGTVAEACQAETADGVNALQTIVSPECCPDGICTGRPGPSCESESGRAYSGRRYLDLADAFDDLAPDCTEGGNCVSICGGEYARAASRVAGRFVGVRHALCLSSLPACETAAGDACETPADREATANYGRRLTVAWSCTGDACAQSAAPVTLAASAYALSGTDACATGLAVELLDELPGGAHVEVTWPTDPAGACAVP
jgi:hypothetical protein